ncbi:MAG TPA: biotin/lipoyl-containing protein [Gemmatimonadaceae bacterium]|jgi:biotin carboxyl carrier protein|nr:biotin/lipoyl-containing protein [Gemmatimonadaceae bacterium]
MRYTVDLAGTTVAIDVGADGATIVPVPGTPIWLLTVGSVVHEIIAHRTGPGRYSLSLAGHRFDAEALDDRARTIREMAAAAGGTVTGPAPLRAPMPGLIVRVHVATGDRVAAGDPLIVMEAMKMENELRAPAAGVVRAIAVTPGTAVEKGTLLVELTE